MVKHSKRSVAVEMEMFRQYLLDMNDRALANAKDVLNSSAQFCEKYSHDETPVDFFHILIGILAVEQHRREPIEGE